MKNESMHQRTAETAPGASYGVKPGLLDLLIGPVERQALEQQGFVAAEYCQGRGPYFKLRFRTRGRQRVVYLGRDAHLAQAIRCELARSQAHRRIDHELAQVTAEAHDALRKSKKQLEKDLDCHGFRFHGYAIRRTKHQVDRNAAQAKAGGPVSLDPISREVMNDDG